MTLEAADTPGVRISDVVVTDRSRSDLGDLASLMDSIQEVGLLHPVVVTRDRVLIAGQRRLEACRRLGWDAVPATFAENVTDAITALTAERDENTCRKDMTMSELVALGRRIEALEKPKAEERQRLHAGTAPGRPAENTVRPGTTSVHEPTDREKYPRTSETVGAAIGLSGRTYERAKRIVTAAESGDEKAAAAVKRMDETNKVRGAYEAFVSPPKRDQPTPGTRVYKARRQHESIPAAMSALRGLMQGIRTIAEIDPEITKEEAASWASDLSESIGALRAFHSKLKEYVNGTA